MCWSKNTTKNMWSVCLYNASRILWKWKILYEVEYFNASEFRKVKPGCWRQLIDKDTNRTVVHLSQSVAQKFQRCD